MEATLTPGNAGSADGAGSAASNDLAEALGQLARALQQETSTEETLARAVQMAVGMVPGAEGGSVSVVAARKKIESWAASGELPRKIDELQHETGEGPCLDAAFGSEIVDVPDMATERRWPHFATRAAEAGVGSMLALRLYVSGGDLGAMNLFNRAPHAFTEESQRTALPFAAHAAIALVQAQQRAHLLTAIDSRDVIGQAKGILMERHRLTADQAFGLRVTASQVRNLKLVEIARELVFTGVLRGTRNGV